MRVERKGVKQGQGREGKTESKAHWEDFFTRHKGRLEIWPKLVLYCTRLSHRSMLLLLARTKRQEKAKIAKQGQVEKENEGPA